MAPSASNKQPWRIIVNDKSFSFYLKRTIGYGKFTPGNDLQLVDMGIALAHFTLAIEASGYRLNSTDSTQMKKYPETEAIAELTLV
jgi:nitroreductase